MSSRVFDLACFVSCTSCISLSCKSRIHPVHIRDARGFITFPCGVGKEKEGLRLGRLNSNTHVMGLIIVIADCCRRLMLLIRCTRPLEALTAASFLLARISPPFYLRSSHAEFVFVLFIVSFQSNLDRSIHHNIS